MQSSSYGSTRARALEEQSRKEAREYIAKFLSLSERFYNRTAPYIPLSLGVFLASHLNYPKRGSGYYRSRLQDVSLALKPDSNMISPSSWHTVDGDQIFRFRNALFKARDRLIPFVGKREKRIRKINALRSCGIVGSVSLAAIGAIVTGLGTAKATPSLASQEFSNGLLCLLIGLAGCACAFFYDPEIEITQGLELDQFEKLSRAIDTFGEQLDSTDPKAWAHLGLSQAGAHFDALTYWDSDLEQRRLIVASFAQPGNDETLANLQESFESFDFTVHPTQNKEAKDGGKP